MPSLDNNQKAFIELVRAGLWEKEARLSQFGKVDYEKIMRLAEEQSVVGLVTAGLEHVKDVQITQEELLQFIGSTIQIEQHNRAMNEFLADLIEKLCKKNVHAVLVKGQGIAQCYEKPLWRASGDIDLLLSEDDYNVSKVFLLPIADEVGGEDKVKKHQALVIKGFDVELHGRMPFGMSERVDRVIDEVIFSSLKEGNVRTWQNNGTDVFLPSINNDVIILFTHFLHHFYIEGVGLRQICDWCRLLWCYRAELDLRLLESRIRQMKLMTEWKVFGALAVVYIGMAKEAMPFYNENQSDKLKKKAERVLKQVMKSGNFGHNNDLSYRTKYKGMTYKAVATWRRFWNFAGMITIFPIDAPRFFAGYMVGKMKREEMRR